MSISAISTPSIAICPASSSTIRERAALMVDFPAPVLPTIPILSPPVILKLRLLSTISVFFLYLRVTS